jgi:hypothetical protein
MNAWTEDVDDVGALGDHVLDPHEFEGMPDTTYGDRVDAGQTEIRTVQDSLNEEAFVFGLPDPADLDRRTDDPVDLPRLASAVDMTSKVANVEVADLTDDGHDLAPFDVGGVVKLIKPAGVAPNDAVLPNSLPNDSLLSLSHFLVESAEKMYIEGKPLSVNHHFKRYIAPLVIVAALNRFFKLSQMRMYFDVCAVRSYERIATPFLGEKDAFQYVLAPVGIAQQFSEKVNMENAGLTNYIAYACKKVTEFWNACHAEGFTFAATLCNTLWFVSSGYRADYQDHWNSCSQLLAVDFTAVKPEWYANHHKNLVVGAAGDRVLWNGYLGSVYRIFSMRQRGPMTLGDKELFPAPRCIQVRDCHQTAPSYGDIAHTRDFATQEYWKGARYEWCIPLTYTPMWAYTEFDKAVPSPIFCYVNAKRLDGETGMIMPDDHYYKSFGLLWRDDAVDIISAARHYRDECRFGSFVDPGNRCYYDDAKLEAAGLSESDRHAIMYPGEEHQTVHDHYMTSLSDEHRYFDYGIDEILISVGLGYFTSKTEFKPAFPDADTDAVLKCFREGLSCDAMPLLDKGHRDYHDAVAVGDPANELSRLRFENSTDNTMMKESVILTLNFGWSFGKYHIWSSAGKDRLTDMAINPSPNGIVKLSQSAFSFFFPHNENKYNAWAYRAYPTVDNEKAFETIDNHNHDKVVEDIVYFLRFGDLDDPRNINTLTNVSPYLFQVLGDRIDAELVKIDDDFFSNLNTKERRLEEALGVFLRAQKIAIYQERLRTLAHSRMQQQRGGGFSSWIAPATLAFITLVASAIPR